MAVLRHAKSPEAQKGARPALGFYRHLGWTEIVAGTNEFGAWVTLRSPRRIL